MAALIAYLGFIFLIYLLVVLVRQSQKDELKELKDEVTDVIVNSEEIDINELNSELTETETKIKNLI